jgi:hypothetical protein
MVWLKLLFIFSVAITSLFGSSKIADIELNSRDNGHDLIIIFDNEYGGIVSRKHGNSIQKVILNDATLHKRTSKKVEDSEIMSKIDILPFSNRVDIAFSMKKRADITYYTADNGKRIIISIIGVESVEKIEPEGKSLFDDLPSGYIGVLFLLASGVIFLLYINNKVKEKRSREQVLDTPIGEESESKDEKDLGWLSGSKRVSLHSIQSPNIDFKIRRNPNSKRKKSLFSNDSLEQLEKDKLSKESSPQIAQVEDIQTKESLPKPPKQEQEKEPLPKESKHIKVEFDERVEAGRVVMFNISGVKYLVLKEDNGDTTLLDKIQPPINDDIADEVDRVKLAVQNEHRVEKERVAVIEKEFDIKLPDEKDVDKEESKIKEIVLEVPKDDSLKKSDDNDLEDLFKDSASLKL